MSVSLRQAHGFERFVDWLSGDLIVVYERPAEAVKRGLAEAFASCGGYVERIPADEASLLIAAGAHPKAICDRLGHSPSRSPWTATGTCFRP